MRARKLRARLVAVVRAHLVARDPYDALTSLDLRECGLAASAGGSSRRRPPPVGAVPRQPRRDLEGEHPRDDRSPR